MDGARWMVGAALLAAAGCGGGPEPAEGPSEMEYYGKLPGLAATPDQDLRAEYARIVEEGGTPELLTSPPLPDEENVAAGLRGLFAAEQLDAVLAEADGIAPPARQGFSYDPVRLHRAVAFWKRYEDQWRAARFALERPRCDFGIRFVEGDAADLSFVKAVWIAARLEMFYAADRLQQEDLDAAIGALARVLRLAECLADEKHFEARGQAAFIRSEGLLLLDAVVRRPKLERKHLETLCTMVEAQLARWPPDAGAWAGERALGMHAFEMVRDGRLLEIAKPQEIEAMGGKDVAKDLPEAVRRTVNSDELYYLRAMRRIIDSCAEPYYRRTAVFQDLRTDLQQKRGTGEFPLIAGHVLLPSIEAGHAIQAKDRAYCEARALALAAGAGLKAPPYRVSPLSGLEYKTVRGDGRVEVSGAGSGQSGDDPRMVVPDLAGTQGPASE